MAWRYTKDDNDVTQHDSILEEPEDESQRLLLVIWGSYWEGVGRSGGQDVTAGEDESNEMKADVVPGLRVIWLKRKTDHHLHASSIYLQRCW